MITFCGSVRFVTTKANFPELLETQCTLQLISAGSNICFTCRFQDTLHTSCVSSFTTIPSWSMRRTIAYNLKAVF